MYCLVKYKTNKVMNYEKFESNQELTKLYLKIAIENINKNVYLFRFVKES
mgnify:CR=1 FL=1